MYQFNHDGMNHSSKTVPVHLPGIYYHHQLYWHISFYEIYLYYQRLCP